MIELKFSFRHTLYIPTNYTLQAKLEKCQATPTGLECAAVHESYITAQWSANLPGKQKVPGSNPTGAA